MQNCTYGDRLNMRKKGIFMVISVFFIILALLGIYILLHSISNNKLETTSLFYDLSTANEMHTNFGYMLSNAINDAGREMKQLGDYTIIYENDSKSSNYYSNIERIQNLAEYLGYNISINDPNKIYLDDLDEEYVYFSPRQTDLFLNTSDSPLYYVYVETKCTNISSHINSNPGSLKLSVYTYCRDSGASSYITGNVSNALINVQDENNVTMFNITVNLVSNHAHLNILKSRNTYLKIVTDRNKSIVPYLDGMISVSKGSVVKRSGLKLDSWINYPN